MSRPILSRPRTRVYGCNYDKGESYYKPTIENLDRKYSGRPLFSEPRNSLADEIAARRSDIGTRDLAGSARHGALGRGDFDVDYEASSSPSTRRPLPPLDTLFDDEETIFDIHGQRQSRPRRPLGEEFANDVASTTSRLKARLHLTSESIDEKLKDSTRGARAALDEAEAAFRRRPRFGPGSRNLGGRNEDDYDFYYGRGYSEDPFEDEFVSNQRRFKDRASAAFDEDLADLRRKRRDMQDRMFDMTDLSAEIEKAKVTLGAADSLFQRHALRFDNEADDFDESISLASRIDRNRKIASQEIPDPKPPVKWTKLVPVEEGCAPPPELMARRTSYGDNPYGNNEPRGKRGYSKRKKSVSF